MSFRVSLLSFTTQLIDRLKDCVRVSKSHYSTINDSRPTQVEAATDNDDSCFSPFSCLTDDVVLEILNKVMDLKTLCICEVVSKRFYAIVCQVDSTICYTTPFPSALDIPLRSIKKFHRVKSLCIRCPSSTQGSITVKNKNNDKTNDVLFKWKAKMGKNRIDSFVFVSPTLIYDKKNGLLLYGEEKDVKFSSKLSIALDCLLEVEFSVAMFKYVTNYFPLLEKVSFTYSYNRGRVSVNGREKVDDLRNWNDVDRIPDRLFQSYLPLLELPVSGYVMKGVLLYLAKSNDVSDDGNYDRFIDDEIDFKHDKEEAPYHEAITEIFKKHKGSIVRLA